MVTYGLFGKPIGISGSILPIPTWIMSLARLGNMQLLILRDLFRGLAKPTILAGDFNDLPDSAVHQTLTGDGSPFRDSWEVLGRSEAGICTRHMFNGEFCGGRIDWILLTDPFQLKEAQIITYNQADRYPSDHFPYYVDLEY